MEKNVKISILCDLYGNLLTKKQFEFLNDYYNNDLTLSEIAENKKITRQAVRDNIIKGEKKLLEYETKLKFMKKTMNQEKVFKEVVKELSEIEKDSKDKRITTIKAKIEDLINAMEDKRLEGLCDILKQEEAKDKN